MVDFYFDFSYTMNKEYMKVNFIIGDRIVATSVLNNYLEEIREVDDYFIQKLTEKVCLSISKQLNDVKELDEFFERLVETGNCFNYLYYPLLNNMAMYEDILEDEYNIIAENL